MKQREKGQMKGGEKERQRSRGEIKEREKGSRKHPVSVLLTD